MVRFVESSGLCLLTLGVIAARCCTASGFLCDHGMGKNGFVGYEKRYKKE